MWSEHQRRSPKTLLSIYVINWLESIINFNLLLKQTQIKVSITIISIHTFVKQIKCVELIENAGLRRKWH